MGTVPLLVIKAALALGAFAPPPEISPEDFRDWFRSASEGDLEIPDSVADRARGYRFVFVLGFLNERMPGYFDQVAAELRAIGVPAGAIHRVAPSSDATFEENLSAIRGAFLSIAEAGPEPIVVVGHSRGACDALAFAMLEPAFVRSRIAALFLVQGPFGGSGAADYLLGSGKPMDDRIPLHTRALGNVLRAIEARKVEKGRHAGITDLTRDAARRFWDELRRDRDGSIPIVGPRTFFIEATVAPGRQPPLRRPVARYLEANYGPNDGLVAAEDQHLPGLGTRLGALDVSHTDLTHRFPASLAPPRIRGALAKAIVMALGHHEDHDAADDPSRAQVKSEDRDAVGLAQEARR